MDAAIMDGKSLNAGAVSIVRRIKNPISLARLVMEKTKHVLLSGDGAFEFAKAQHVALKQNSYFITQHQMEEFQKTNKQKKLHGTVGAVTLDKNGNVAAATSTGGTHYSLPGRVGDSCIIGAGCYANNTTCAISSTGEGEYIIKGVVAHTISMMIELKKLSLQKACDYVIHHRSQAGEMGVIALDANGRICFSFNTQIMPRGFIDINGNLEIKI
jgi:beta-aspartyl-peptidase (threonine type)